MGLDISVYRKVEFVRPRSSDIERDFDDADNEGLVFLHNEEVFRERSDGLADGFYRSTDEESGFRAGSYSGYDRWRGWLAALVGTSPEALWAIAATDEGRATPFYELINFTDCDGFIGPVTSAKLARDFDAWHGRVVAAAVEFPRYAELFDQWRAAFTAAADHGAVRFH